MKKKDVIGVRVWIVLEEDGTDHPPSLPPGTIVQRLIGGDRDDYYLVQLDAPVRSIRATTGEPWVLHQLVVATRWVGSSLDFLRSRGRKGTTAVGVMNLLSPLEPDASTFEFEKGEYFAIGWIQRMRRRQRHPYPTAATRLR